MGGEFLSFIQSELDETLESFAAARRSDGFMAQISACAELMIESLREGGKIMFAGNGGSAADAQHIAGEFVSRLNYDRAPLAGLALTTDTSVLTATGNDYGYEQVFSRQVAGLGAKGDVFVGISTSGRSPNILSALKAARAKSVRTIGFMGVNGGPMTEFCDVSLNAPSPRTPMIQQLHITAAHIICGLVERAMFPVK